MVLKRLKKYAAFYKIAHNKRVQMYNLKFRVVAVMLIASIMLLVNDYLQNRYPYGVFDAIKGVKFMLADRLFEWFAIGVIFGAIALGALYEGEFMLSIRKLVKHFERQTFGMLQAAKAKNAKAKKPAHKKR